MKLQVASQDIVERLAPDLKPQGLLIAAELQAMDLRLKHVESYRGIINYAYWEMRCQAEQKSEAVAAHRNLLNAKRALEDTDLEKAREEFESAWKNWAKVLESHPTLMDAITGDELYDEISLYERVLQQLGVNELPDDFPLKELRARKQAKHMPPPTTERVPPDTANPGSTPPGTPPGKSPPTRLVAPPIIAPPPNKPPSDNPPNIDKPKDAGKAKGASQGDLKNEAKAEPKS